MTLTIFADAGETFVQKTGSPPVDQSQQVAALTQQVLDLQAQNAALTQQLADAQRQNDNLSVAMDKLLVQRNLARVEAQQTVDALGDAP